MNIVDKLPFMDWEEIKQNIKNECICCSNKQMDATIAVNLKSILLFDLFKETKYTLFCLDCWMNYNLPDFKSYLVTNYTKQHKFDNQQVEEIIKGVYKINYNNLPILLIAESLGNYPHLTIPEIAKINLPIVCGVKIILT